MAGDSARLQKFTSEIFRTLDRPEQHRWARAYLWALLHVPGKKTTRRLARAEELPPAAAHGLHWFINASPWAWEPVRRTLALRASASAAPFAWTVAELVIPKSGKHSVGVHPWPDAASGRTVNGQRAVGLFLVTGTYCFPVDWSLVLSGPWEEDRQLRRRARIPEPETAQPVGSHVLDHAAGIAGEAQLPNAPWVLDLTRDDDAAAVLAGLARLRLDVVCEIDQGQVVLTSTHSPTAIPVGELMEVRHARRPQGVVRQSLDGRAGRVPVYAYAGTVRLPGPGTDDTSGSRTYRVLERPDPEGRQAARYWITSLTDRRVEEILGLVRARAAALTTIGTLRERFGVLDFEGRSFPGWHHHMTMACAAYVYRYLYGAPGAVPQAPAPPSAELTEAAS
ncbi:transposase [Streptomyces sp. NBC_00388]